jgi:hypothetical protein
MDNTLILYNTIDHIQPNCPKKTSAFRNIIIPEKQPQFVYMTDTPSYPINSRGKNQKINQQGITHSRDFINTTAQHKIETYDAKCPRQIIMHTIHP